MKIVIFLGMTILVVMVSFAQEEGSPIEDGYQMVYGDWSNMNASFPGRVTGTDVKMWTKDCFVFAVLVQLDTMEDDNYGWGKYRFIWGNRYEESVILHNFSPNLDGEAGKFLMDVRNDSVIQRWPVDENWNLVENTLLKYMSG